MDEGTIAVFDVETTGLSPAYGDRICEVGIVRARGETIIETYQSLVNPQRPISPGAARVNGIRDAEVLNAPLFAEIAGRVLALLDGAVMVCHNAPFDLGFLTAELSHLGRSWQPDGVIDTLELARRHYHFSSNSLSAVAARLGVESPHAHRALSDALTTFQVYRRIYRQLNGLEGGDAWEFTGGYRPAVIQLDEIPLPPEIQEALAENKAIHIVYLDAKGDETHRTITPLRVQAANQVVYLFAYCHLRQAERSFRLDRIVSFGEVK